MACCSCRPYKTSDSRKLTDYNSNQNYKTSSNRAHYYENVIDHPLNHLHVKRKSRKDLKIRDEVMLDLNRTTYDHSFNVKYWDDRKPEDRMNRFSFEKTDLRSMHEKCMKNPIMPMKFRQSTTADHYLAPGEIRTPSSVSKKSPVEESACPVRALGRDEFPSVPANEPGYSKHLDIFVSTTQLGHPRFTLNQQNGVARKDIRTFYDMNGTPKCRGFGPKSTMPIGAYFHRDMTQGDKVRLKSICRVPYFGKKSEYAAQYDHVLTNLMHMHKEIQFPPIIKNSEFDALAAPAMYCTESCHIGTGWPVKASVNIGKVRGTF